MPLSSTALNPGVGGDSIVDFAQSGGAKMPISALSTSPDGVADFTPVTTANPLPVALSALSPIAINPNTGAAIVGHTIPTNGINEQAVYDQRAAARRDELALTLQTLLDLLTNGPVPVVEAAVQSATSSVPSQQSVGTTAGTILGANNARKELIVQNTGTATVYLGLGQTPTTTAYHMAIAACANATNDGSGGSFVSDLWKGSVVAIATVAGGTVVVTELV